METLLAASINTTRRGGVIQKLACRKWVASTTLMTKAIAHPTDSGLLDKSRQHLVKTAQDSGLRLR